MSLVVGDNLPEECTSIKTGVIFRMFTSDCTFKLGKFPTEAAPLRRSSYFTKLPSESKRDNYVAYESGQYIPICDVDNVAKPYAKKGYMLRMKAKKPSFGGKPWRITTEYAQGINPLQILFGIPNKGRFVSTGVTDADGFISANAITAPAVGDINDSHSSGIGTASINCQLKWSDPSNPCSGIIGTYDAQLESLGLPYDYLAGMSDHFGPQDQGVGSSQFDRTVWAFYWTGVAFFYPAWAFGARVELIMGLSHSLEVWGAVAE